MKAILYNRILLMLGFIGLFVAGTLSAGHILHLAPPCSEARGCEKVLSDPTSKLFGIPVAFLGLAAYATLVAFAFARSTFGLKQARVTITLGTIVAGAGAMFSVYLQYAAFFLIGSFCPWCFTSALTMITTFVVHALYMSHVGTLDEVPSTPARDDKLIAVLLASVLIGGFVSVRATRLAGRGLVESVKIENPNELVPDDAHIYGAKEAPITIVEFADLLCPTCQQFTPRVKGYINEHAGKVRLIYRHDPLEKLHPMANVVAALSEYAGEKQNFFEFSLAVMSTLKQQSTKDEVLAFAQKMGIDVEDFKRRVFADPPDPIVQRVQRDRQVAKSNSINMTPTFLVFLTNNPSKVTPVSSTELFEVLGEPRFKAILDGPK